MRLKLLASLFRRDQANPPAVQPDVQPEQESWGLAWERAKKISDGFDRLATAARQYRDSADSLGKDLFALYEGDRDLKERYLGLLRSLVGLADYCEQIAAGDEALASMRERVSGLLDAQRVERFVPKEGEPVDTKYCEIVSKVESRELPPGMVAKVVATGYFWNDVPLQPAKVIATAQPLVAKSATEPLPADKQQEQDPGERR